MHTVSLGIMGGTSAIFKKKGWGTKKFSSKVKEGAMKKAPNLEEKKTQEP